MMHWDYACVSPNDVCVSQVAKIIWLCEGGTVKEWPGDIYSYKEHIMKRVRKFDHVLGRSN